MMNSQHFKPELFFTLPVCALVLCLICASLITDEWVTGVCESEETGTGSNYTGESSNIDYNYGLFKGEKVLQVGSSTRSLKLKVICSQGVCMYTCSKNKKDDINDILSDFPLYNNYGDNCYCDSQEACTNATYDSTDIKEEDKMMNKGTWASTIAFLIIGLVFTVVASIFAALNAFSNPIETIVGVHGLIAWNAIAAFNYFLAICIYAGEYGSSLTEYAPISNVIREGTDLNWDCSGTSDLGYSYWLVFTSIFCHGANIGIVLYYIRKKVQTKAEGEKHRF